METKNSLATLEVPRTIHFSLLALFTIQEWKYMYLLEAQAKKFHRSQVT